MKKVVLSPSTIKGIVSTEQINIFLLRPIQLSQYFLLKTQMVFNFFFFALFLLASFKTLTNSKNCSESHIRFLFWLSLIGRFCPVYTFLMAFWEQLSRSQPAFGTTFRVPGGYQRVKF